MPTQSLMRISYRGYWEKKKKLGEDTLHQYDALDIQKLTNCTAYINFGSIMLTSCPNINGKLFWIWGCRAWNARHFAEMKGGRQEGRKKGKKEIEEILVPCINWILIFTESFLHINVCCYRRVKKEWTVCSKFLLLFMERIRKCQVPIYPTLIYVAKIGQKYRALKVFPEHKVSIR